MEQALDKLCQISYNAVYDVCKSQVFKTKIASMIGPS